jgi:hyaluronoglucosaminidase
MDESVVDEPGLRALLGRAVACEPPIGPLAYQALEAGIRRRLRRRVSGAVACLVVAGVVGVTVPAIRSASMRPATGGAATIYVASKGQITPVWTATRTAGVPIGDNVDAQDQAVLAATPDGKTLYVADTEMSWVTPISTATNTAGPRITTGAGPYAIAATPDGSTAYVANSGAGTVTPISTVTGVPGRPIRIGGEPVGIAITPDGRTAYVLSDPPGVPGTVTPISTATDVPGRPIRLEGEPVAIGITPDGDTAYVACLNTLRDPGTVVPISTATNKAGTPIEIPVGPLAMVIVAGTRGAA